MRVVLDTNILVSALISRSGPPGQLLALVQQRRATLVTSSAQLDELRDVLARDRLKPYINAGDAQDLLATLDAVAQLATELPKVSASPDPDDNAILATAIAGNVELIVSGDKHHMLALHAVQGIPIVTAKDALSRLTS
ncbi:MAG: putative toxin-antitoxin system toxin component, PIN family [Salinisphaera sp.]|nr:putative toxin-antitoxin system toxin component, PIN family [Salinisphaera sp.]